MWPAVAQFTTVVACSRSGIGRSDPGPEEHSARRAAAELHALLARLRIPPPYVLAGRSDGGIGAVRAFYDSLLGTLPPGAEAAETSESMRIDAG